MLFRSPIGKVFDEDELRSIGNIAEEHDLMILSDEVVRALPSHLFSRGN